MSRVLNNWDEYIAALDELDNEGYEFHHSALKRGYMSRKITGVLSLYDGRFGKGYIIEMPRRDNNNYHTIMYFILN